MSNRNPSHLGPPSPTSPATTPTTPTALVPASRDFLVPIGSTGALQKFSVANAAQKRKTVADRRAQANAHAHVHIAAAEAGWHTPDPAPRAASSLVVSSYSSAYNPSSRAGNHIHHPTGLAPVEVQHRPSSATGYSPTSSIMSSSLSAQPSKSGNRSRTISSHDSRPATAGAWMETQKGTFRPVQGQMSNSTNTSMASSNNRAEQGFSGTASPGEKKRTFTKGLRGLFSSGSSRKALASRDGGAQSPSIQQQQQHQPNQSSGLWSGSSTTASSPYSSGFSTMTGSVHETFLEKDRWSAASSSNNHKPLPPPGGSQPSMRSASAQGSHPSSNAPQPPFSTLGSSARDGEVHAISGSAHSHIRGDSKAQRTDSQRSRTTTRDRSATTSTTETSDPPGRSRILSSLDSFAKSPQQSSDGGGYGDRDGDQYSVDGSTSTPRTPQLSASTDSRRESTGPPKLDFNLPSPGFYLDDMDRPPREGEREMETSPRSQGRSRRGSAAERGDTSAAPSSSSLAGAAVVLEGGIGELARRRSSRATNLGKPQPVRLGSIASSSSSGGAGHPLARTADSSTSSAPSVDFLPGPSFGQFDSGPGVGVLNAPVLLRSPPTPVSPRPLSTANSSPLSVPPASGTQRSSVSSGMSQATSIAAITKGWQVEPDTNPPLHPSAVYGPRASGSMASLTSQESGVGASRSRRGSTAASASVVSSDGRASVASTVVGRSNNATPLGRPFVNGSAGAGAGAGAGMGVGLDGSASSDTFAALSPNPLLAPLFERLPVGGAGTDDGVPGGMFSLGHGSFDSSNHHHHHHGGLGSTVSHGANHSGGSGGNGSTMSHGNPGHGSSTIGHSTLGHGTQGHGTEDLGLAQAAGSRSGSPRNSIQGHAQGSSASHAASFTTASSGGHGNGRPVGAPTSRRPGSSGGAAAAAAAAAAVAAGGAAGAPTTNKAGRPTTPRGGVVPGFEQPPTALRTTPSSHSRSASLKGASTRLDMDAATGTASGSGSESSSLRGGAAPLLPSRSKDRPRLSRPSTAGSTKSTDTSSLMPLQDPAMLATLAKLESAQARSTASPLNLATFSEANLRSALVNGAVERPGRGPSGGGSEDDGDHLHRADGKANGAVVGGGDVSSGSVDGASLAKEEAKDVQEKTKATKAAVILNGLPVPEDADPKTYVPSNALTRTRRGAQVGAAAAKAAEQAEQLQAALKTPPTMQSSSSYDGRSPNRFSLDSDEDDDALRHRGRMGDDAPTPTPQTPTPAAPGYPRGREGEEGEDDLSSSDGLVSDEDEQEGGDDELEVGQGGAAGAIISRGVSTDSHASRRSAAPAVDNQMPANAWVEVEAALKRFRDEGGVTAAEAAAAAAASGAAAAGGPIDKGGLLRSILLPFLALEGETPSVDVPGPSKFRNGKARRALFFDWIRSLLGELQQTQTSADRGAILESIGCVLESRNLGARILERDGGDWEEFNSIFGLILGWAIGELNKKGVYQNTLIFTGRLLAIAFFRIHGVASKLLRALPVNRFALERVSSEADCDLGQPRSFERYRKRFPQHLREFCFQDARSYLKMLDGQTPPGVGDLDSDDDRYLVRQDEVEVEMAGNWLRRWQSDDSELFFSFIRSYHRQMSTLLTSTKRLRKISKWFFGGPGYAHLATSVHQKCLSMVHREIFSVTTLSSQKTFNPGETANVLSGSTAGKPRHLEAANRRCTAIVVEIARTGHPNTNAQLFSGMLGVHVKSVVKRTSLYDAEGVFCLLDWLDGIISQMDAAELPVDTFLDVDFLIDMVSMLLNTADHALALMRTIAFCYSNFAVLTSHKDTRLRFCESILLEPVIFHKLFLSWSVTIRAYFLHLLVFRLARISDFPNPKADPNGKTQVRVARLFNQRLDEIRRRYEELSPSIPTEDDGDDFTRFKNRPASFVSTIKHTASVHRPEAMSKAERILGIGLPDPAMASKSGADSAKQSLAAKWLRGLGAKGKKSRWSNGKAAVGMSETDSPTVNNEPRKKMLLLDELDFDDADVDSSGTDEEPSLGGEGTNDADSVSDAKMIAPAEGSAVVADSDIGMGDNITPDASFDLQSAAPPLAAGPGRSGASPRVSRAFSKRSSILPGPAFDLVGDETADTPPVPALPGHVSHPYDKTLHTYAVQSLTEYERTIQEHDQYFGAQPETEKAQVPRLQVNWPAMWQD
ncbi:unnamed protein product [Tilletia controversa]|uniref:Uncharacterized protein n=1 Tax=Tilletia controversa TaxID=13291 RepID=A0A8X7MYL3_9BASI|nr:hypothetical protein CF328_g710 [Tilletia controversa]KAE8254741.1 hypothetical protein A4X06_0g758 [Tilletia controversa]CAD6938652.1 unnamed protein product [Tilletia controversa]CAD6984133.1 unnamed protein product [Tilletia controversa]